MTKEDEKVLALYFYADIRLYVDSMYRYRNEVRDRIIFKGFGSQKMIESSEKFRRYCLDERISYVMFPYSPDITFPGRKTLKERFEMTNHLKMNMSDDFEEVAKFSLDDNYIIVYRPRDNNAGKNEGPGRHL